jgi:hypothetical protein
MLRISSRRVPIVATRGRTRIIELARTSAASSRLDGEVARDERARPAGKSPKPFQNQKKESKILQNEATKSNRINKSTRKTGQNEAKRSETRF